MKIRLAAPLAAIVLLSACSTIMSAAVNLSETPLGACLNRIGTLQDSIQRDRAVETALALIRSGADPNAKIVRGDKKIPVLIRAYAVKQPVIARALLDKGADPLAKMEPSGGTVLHLLAETGNVGEAREVIARAKLAARQRTDSPEEADQIFFEWLDRPFEAGYTALHVAAMHGKMDIIPLLLENGADPSLKDKGNRTAQYYLDQRKGPAANRSTERAG
jgi:hypothetical protein